MILLLTGIFLGSLVGYLLCRLGEGKKILELKFKNEELLDFNQRLVREKGHLEVPVMQADEDWPEEVSFQ
jgi:hypothetical protein